MNLYIIQSSETPVKQVLASNCEAAIQMYLNRYPGIEAYDLDYHDVGVINGCVNGYYLISTSFPQWSEDNRIETKHNSQARV